MIDTLNFLNQDFWPHVTILGLLLWVFFIWKEWSPKLKPKFYLHVLIALVSISSLAMLALRPMIWTSAKTNAGVLLTENYQKQRLDSLNREYKNLKVIPYKVNQPLGKVIDSISSLFILGNGLRSFDFWQLKNLSAQYLEAPITKGIIKLKYPNKLFVGDEFVLRGIYYTPRKGHHLLLADSSGKEIDSVLMDTVARSDFELSADLKIKGNYVYKILEKDSLGTVISAEPLPIKVLPKEKLRALMINSFPTFESKYLKNFLAEAGNELTVRSQLTRGKFKFEYFNTERRPFYSFSKKQLEPLDLVIIDANSYVNLSKKSKQIFSEATQEYGLGVFILPNEKFFRLPVKTTHFEFLKQQSSKINLDGWPRLSWEKYPYVFKDLARWEEVHGSSKKTLTAYSRNGRGRIGTTVIRNSYQLLLDGNPEAYAKFWSEAISGLSKRWEATAEWSSNSQFVFEDEPFEFRIRTFQENPKVIGNNGRISLKQNIDIPELWSGITYPKKIGWNKIHLKNDSTATLDFYVMDSTQWKSITTYNTIEENKRQFNSIADITANTKVLIPVNQLWFFLIFILSMGYLWLTPKLFQN